MGNRETLQTTAIPISNYKQNNTEEIPSKEYERLIIGKLSINKENANNPTKLEGTPHATNGERCQGTAILKITNQKSF